MHKLKVVKTSEGLAVLLPDEVVARLDLAEGAEVVLSEGAEGYTLGTERDRSERVRKATQKIFEHYSETLRDLAK